jgi:hypothetical protein
MERDKYLTLCRQAKTQPQTTVLYMESQYTPVAYKLHFDDNGNAIHTAILHSLRANSIMECLLANVY